MQMKLDAMAYPYPFDPERMDFPHFHKFIVWLEDTQIRFNSEEQRGPLKTFVEEDPQEWWRHFADYCKRLGYKKSVKYPSLDEEQIIIDGNLKMLLDWLVGKAMRYFYVDDNGVEKYNAGHQEFLATQQPLYKQLEGFEKAQESNKANAVLTPTFKIESMENLRPAVAQLFSTLRLEPSGDIAADLALVSRIIKQLIIVKGDAKGAKEALDKDPNELLAQFPLGFEVPDPKLEAACKILRLLYTADLRDLQDRIDEVIVKLQNITGDPKTDTRLGKVGS